MAITFQEQIKKQRNLIFIFVIIAFITLFIVWRGYYVGEEPSEIPTPKPFKKIKIDFGTLESPALQQFQPIEKIPSFTDEVGRENPFIPF